MVKYWTLFEKNLALFYLVESIQTTDMSKHICVCVCSGLVHLVNLLSEFLHAHIALELLRWSEQIILLAECLRMQIDFLDTL